MMGFLSIGKERRRNRGIKNGDIYRSHWWRFQKCRRVAYYKKQADSLSRCYRHSLNAASFLKESSPEYELVSFELREAIKQIDVILGATCADDIITKIFDDFCVGK